MEIRQQYTLDFSRPEVVAGIWQQLDAVLQSCPLKYLKWDMNRSLAQVYSAVLPAKRQGEVYHRYVLGVYELQRRLTEKYPTCCWKTVQAAEHGSTAECSITAPRSGAAITPMPGAA